jgi:hypothetical protein
MKVNQQLGRKIKNMGSSADKYYEDLEDESIKRQEANRLERKKVIINEINEMSDDDLMDFFKVYEEKKEILEYFKTLDMLRFKLNGNGR